MTADKRKRLAVRLANYLYNSKGAQYQLSQRAQFKEKAKALKEVLYG